MTKTSLLNTSYQIATSTIKQENLAVNSKGRDSWYFTNPCLLLVLPNKICRNLCFFSGSPNCSFPSAILFIRKVIFLASVRIVCLPSSSFSASPGAAPWMLFQYWLEVNRHGDNGEVFVKFVKVAESASRGVRIQRQRYISCLLSNGVLKKSLSKSWLNCRWRKHNKQACLQPAHHIRQI